MLPFTPNLQVLELRGCVKVTNVRPIVEFRRKWRQRGVLIEGCEVFEGRMRRGEEDLEREERGEHVEHRSEPMVLDE
jgi:antagonist of mitotic exit network protein 1